MQAISLLKRGIVLLFPSPSFSPSACPSETETYHVSVSSAVKWDNIKVYFKGLVWQLKSYNVWKGFTGCLAYIKTWYSLLELDHGSHLHPLSVPMAFPSWDKLETEDEFPGEEARGPRVNVFEMNWARWEEKERENCFGSHGWEPLSFLLFV